MKKERTKSTPGVKPKFDCELAEVRRKVPKELKPKIEAYIDEVLNPFQGKKFEEIKELLLSIKNKD